MIDIYRIVTEAQESEEEFIFTTIQPFCEDVTKRKISKAELVRLLSQPKIVRCGECRFFELNHFDSLDGVPIITAHEICTKWGSGCKTDRNGYCFMAERKVDDETD